jgi:predicted phosphodiesterase
MQTSIKRNVITAKINDVNTEWTMTALLVSDQHHDSPLCNRKLEKEHLEEAKFYNAPIFMGGDLFDAMQGHKDPRASYDNLDPELKKDNYFDACVDFNAKFYGPYAKQIVLMAKGNHETSVMKHHNIDLIERLAYKLNMEHGSNIHVGGYGGWVRFMFTINKTKGVTINMKYYHGAGGDAPVTRGVIQTARQAVYLPDADIVWNGHNHNEYALPIQRERLSDRGEIYQDTQWHVRTPGYKNGYQDGSKGWEIESGMPPKPFGCVWLKFYCKDSKIKIKAIQDVV